jgi:transposase
MDVVLGTHTTSRSVYRNRSTGRFRTGPGRSADAAAERLEQTALVTRTRQRYAAVQALLGQGKGIKPIMRELGLAKETVRRFARAASVEDLLAKARDGRPSVLDEFKPYLHERWNAGCTTVWTLFTEIRSQLRRKLQHHPRLSAAVPGAGRRPTRRPSTAEGPQRDQLDAAPPGQRGKTSIGTLHPVRSDGLVSLTCGDPGVRGDGGARRAVRVPRRRLPRGARTRIQQLLGVPQIGHPVKFFVKN